MAGLGRKTWAADEILAADDLQGYIQDQVVFVFDSEGARTSGILSPSEGMVSYLKNTNLLYVFDGSSWVEVAPDVGTPGQYTKVTTDFKGRVTSGALLSASDIPALDSSKITTGGFDASRITTGGFDASRITSGTLTRPLDTTTVLTSGNITSGGQVFGTSMLTPSISGGAQGWSISGSGGNFSAGISSIGVYNNSLGGTYRAVWINNSGVLGHTSSSIIKKEDVVDANLSPNIVSELRPVTFKYKNDVAEFGDNAQEHIGLIAEELLDIPGMERFVFFDDVDGVQVPAGIHYELLAVALIPAIQKQDEQIKLLEARLSKLEK
jgi:hypothetical protein